MRAVHALLALVVLLGFGASARAQPATLTCADPENPVMLEQEGFGVITAQEFGTEGETTSFEVARLEYRSWILRAKLLVITGQRLEASAVCLEIGGAAGTAARLEWSQDRFVLTDLDLRLEPSFQLPESLPAGRYRLRAASGSFEGNRLRAEDAVLDRLNDRLETIERYRADAVGLESGRLQAEGLGFAGASVALSGQSAIGDNDRVETGPVSGFLGRNSAGGEVAFSAQRAILFASGAVRLEGVTLTLFGLPIITLPSVDLPGGLIMAGAGVAANGGLNGVDQPFRLGFSDGLNLGLERLRLSSNADARLSVQLHRLFNAAPTVSFALEGTSGADRVLFGQPFVTGTGPGTVRFRASREPVSGATVGVNLISDVTVLGPCQYDCDPFVDATLGYAQRLEFGALALRPKLEVGAAWQPARTPDPAQPSSLTQSLGFVRGSAGLSWAGRLEPFSLGLVAALDVTGFIPGPNLDRFSLGANLSATVTAQYVRDGFSLSGAFSYVRPFGDSPIRRYRADIVTQGALSAQLGPLLRPPPLGFDGLALEKPRFGLNLIYDFWLGLWQKVELMLDTDVSYYDGLILTDHFGQRFQTPVFVLSPVARIDLAARLAAASLGANVTLFGPGLAYTLGAFFDWRADGTTGWRFSAGVRFR